MARVQPSTTSMSHNTLRVDVAPLTSGAILVGVDMIGPRGNNPWPVPQRRSLSGSPVVGDRKPRSPPTEARHALLATLNRQTTSSTRGLRSGPASELLGIGATHKPAGQHNLRNLCYACISAWSSRWEAGWNAKWCRPSPRSGCRSPPPLPSGAPSSFGSFGHDRRDLVVYGRASHG